MVVMVNMMKVCKIVVKKFTIAKDACMAYDDDDDDAAATDEDDDDDGDGGGDDDDDDNNDRYQTSNVDDGAGRIWNENRLVPPRPPLKMSTNFPKPFVCRTHVTGSNADILTSSDSQRWKVVLETVIKSVR